MMEPKGIILQGSSRSAGNTSKICNFVKERTGFEVVDLRLKRIGHFDYNFENKDDDFIPLIKSLAHNYDIILLATPVYWYSMSGIMKIFFDRITDCLRDEKEIGRKLRGKKMAMISCGSDAVLINGFKMPFVETARYLEMNYLGDIHTWLEEGSLPEPVKQNLEYFIT
ncbi:flavodoxin family protein, partial [Pontibacter pamirensis]|uniref:flavodoxin family protein n=1 Tax=Pontibacter pamirensis TaxID=2562824 RepID=UPI001F3800DE